MYDKKQVQAKKNDKFEEDEIDMKTRTNFAKKDGKKMNEFCDKMAEKM